VGRAVFQRRLRQTIRDAMLSLGTRATDHTRRPCRALNGADLLHGMVHGGGHGLMQGLRVGAFHEQRRPAVTLEQLAQLLMADAGQQGRVVDLVAIEVEDRQHRAVPGGVQEFVDMPGGSQRAGFRLAIADHGGDDQFRVVERRPAGMREHIAQFTAFMD